MTEQELRHLLKEHGWNLQLRARRKSGKRYAYAKRRNGMSFLTRYLCPEDDLPKMKDEDILPKLAL